MTQRCVPLLPVLQSKTIVAQSFGTASPPNVISVRTIWGDSCNQCQAEAIEDNRSTLAEAIEDNRSTLFLESRQPTQDKIIQGVLRQRTEASSHERRTRCPLSETLGVA